MVGKHYWLNGHESEQAPGVCDGQAAAVHGAAKSQIWLHDWTELKDREAWQATTHRSHRVGQEWSDSACVHRALLDLYVEQSNTYIISISNTVTFII